MVEREVRTLERLSAAAARGVDPERARARLQVLRGMVGGEVERLEARLPELCADAPRDVAAAARHLLGAGGKRVRPLLVLLAARAAGSSGSGSGSGSERVAALATAAELVHNATLLHDDVIDEGRTRRGVPAARVVWGNTVSVLGGDFLLARALELVEGAGVPGALSALLAVIRRMVDGEALQLERRGKLDPDEGAYREVVDAKTASLFAWCGRAGGLANGPGYADALAAYGFHLGRAFQIVDDCLDLDGDASLGKDLLADVREGKLTLPMLYALRSEPGLTKCAVGQNSGEILNGWDLEACPREALDAARAEARVETVAACAALEVLPLTPYRQALAGIARELAERGC